MAGIRNETDRIAVMADGELNDDKNRIQNNAGDYNPSPCTPSGAVIDERYEISGAFDRGFLFDIGYNTDKVVSLVTIRENLEETVIIVLMRRAKIPLEIMNLTVHSLLIL